jgi:tetratricopeptide (TPR) repeat protein
MRFNSPLWVALAGLVTALLTTQSAAQTAQQKSRANSNTNAAPNSEQRAQAIHNLQAAQVAFDQLETTPQITRRQLNATVDPEVMRGYKALQQNQFSQAREAYSQVLSRNATQRDALLGIAYAHHALGDTAQAVATLRQLINLYPRDSDAVSALYLIGGGEPQEQESKLKQMLERSERPAALHYALGVVYFEQSRFGEAERAFDRAFAMEPEQADYAFNLAISLDRLGRLREAARQYVVALNLANQTSSVFSREVARSRLRALTSAAK